MKFSLFTPTHNATHLARLDASLRKQTCQDFEWIVVPNGGLKPRYVKPKSDKAKIVPYAGATQGIGELKAFACAQATGEILVEVDHDDELTPNCLERLAEAFDDETDFVYSNCIEIKPDGTPNTYNPCFGWEYRPFQWNGKTMPEMIAFPPGPASFSKIWYAPNHVRAWRREFYEHIGGHDKSLAVLDDHDLLCRTYIAGTVKHVDECLYVYHVHPGNTCAGEKNKFIQTDTLRIHDKYIEPMAMKWCDLNGLRKIDICCGEWKRDGYEGVDVRGADITADLNDRWPFEDGTAGLIRASDALEHLRDPIHTMKEAYRVLATNGWLLTNTPSTDGRGAWQDPTHCSWWNRNSFYYYTRREQAAYIQTPVRFQEARIADYFPSKWHETNKCPYVMAHLLKFDGRTPGKVEI